MRDDDLILDTAELLVDAVALSQALLDGDLSEARFRARLIATKAPAIGFDEVHVAAVRVIDRLGTPGGQPLPGYAAAVMELSGKVEQAAAFLRS